MLRTVVIFGAGYVLGAKAGRERYAQIEEAAKNLSRRLADARGPAVDQRTG